MDRRWITFTARRPAAPSPDDLLRIAGLAVVIAVGVAQLGDLLTFIRMVAVAGIEAELNPLVSHGATTIGLLPLIVAKVALIALVGSVFVIVSRTHRRMAAALATFGTLAGLVGAFSNALAIA